MPDKQHIKKYKTHVLFHPLRSLGEIIIKFRHNLSVWLQQNIKLVLRDIKLRS